jgi:hypothetical protein
MLGGTASIVYGYYMGRAITDPKEYFDLSSNSGCAPYKPLLYNEQVDLLYPVQCSYCGCNAESNIGTCKHCGAPLNRHAWNGIITGGSCG